MPPSSPYDELPPAIRRANLLAHRSSLLSDRHAQELHARRLELFETDDAAAARARLDKFDVALGEVDAELAALPAEPDAPAG